MAGMDVLDMVNQNDMDLAKDIILALVGIGKGFDECYKMMKKWMKKRRMRKRHKVQVQGDANRRTKSSRSRNGGVGSVEQYNTVEYRRVHKKRAKSNIHRTQRPH